MFQTFRHRLLFWFLVFITSSLLIIALSYTYITKREKIHARTEAIDQSYVLLLKSVKAQQDFFSYETKSQNFFKTGGSHYLDYYLKLLDSTRYHLQQIDFSSEPELASLITEIKSDITEIDSVFLSLIIQIQARGFKNYNLEGSMRRDAHWLEKQKEIPIEDILSLRRHEKDYIIRNEEAYTLKFSKLVVSMREEILKNNRITKKRKDKLLHYLHGYEDKLTQLVKLDELIGIKNNTGLKEELDQRITVSEVSFSNVVYQTQLWKEKEFNKLTFYFIFITIVLVIGSIAISTYISKKITIPLTELTTHITRFVDSKFTLESEYPVIRTEDEIGRLTRNFSFLKDEVISRLKFFKQKVDERTTELANANTKLLRLSEANSRFVPKEFLNNLGKDSIEEVRLGDQVEQEMTIIFSDIREFTKISESLSPQENFDFINSYLNGIVPIIRRNKGFIDKFIGDSVMALFPKDSDFAIKAVCEFEEFLISFNKKLEKENKRSIQIGTGIHTGNLILGTIGHDHRLETTVISDAVNTASRVEGLTKHYQAKIIGTEATISKLKNKKSCIYRFLDTVRVKGKSKTLSVYEFLSPQDKEKLSYLDQYNKAVSQIRNKKIAEAATMFSALHKEYPNDKAVQIFLEKCNNYLAKKSSSWDEITNMITK
ncbi:adenylate/guanylate cyclase domain-containing protein [Aquimarina sp. AU474]|uniref:adenylate/guanylate cyclase domain-containing protein n=1 Tax=Aquimarina sp. AU474 TaxID=2108529 RepID=UPI000D69B7CD|nr:adenylate/guanylate cyclase domain-containing protein [Aquimarina sp. AU474]